MAYSHAVLVNIFQLFNLIDFMGRNLGINLKAESISWAVVEQSDDVKDMGGKVLDMGTSRMSFENFTFRQSDGKLSGSDIVGNFSKGFSVSPNLVRRQSRQQRRRYDRRSKRMGDLKGLLIREGFITSQDLGKMKRGQSPLEIFSLRAAAACREVSLQELSRVLLHMNKKRGYRSAAKGELSDKESKYLEGIRSRSDLIRERGITIGQYLEGMLRSEPLKGVKHQLFYRADLLSEFERIWKCQMAFHPELTLALKKQIRDRIMFF